MKKIPTIFERAGKFVVPRVNPKAAWVFEEESMALRKYDGVCTMFDGTEWWTRRSWQGRLQQKMDMHGVLIVEYDPTTQKTFGWERNGSFSSYINLAFKSPPLRADFTGEKEYVKGTYELIGPKINSNAENMSNYRLVEHVRAEQISNVNVLDINKLEPEKAFEALKATFGYLDIEGVVFYGKSGQLAKLKRKDFNYAD